MTDLVEKRDTLNVINNMIDNCDTKTSICLSAYAVIVSVLLSSDFSNQLIKLFCLLQKKATVIYSLYMVIMVVAVIIIIVGLYKLFMVLVPVIDTTHESITFFGNIGLFNSFLDYKTEVERFSLEQANEDILYQIYSASKICRQKFYYQRQGMFLLGIGTIMLFAISIFGIMII